MARCQKSAEAAQCAEGTPAEDHKTVREDVLKPAESTGLGASMKKAGLAMASSRVGPCEVLPSEDTQHGAKEEKKFHYDHNAEKPQKKSAKAVTISFAAIASQVAREGSGLPARHEAWVLRRSRFTLLLFLSCSAHQTMA